MALSGGYIDVIGAGDHGDSRHVDAGQWCLTRRISIITLKYCTSSIDVVLRAHLAPRRASHRSNTLYHPR